MVLLWPWRRLGWLAVQEIFFLFLLFAVFGTLWIVLFHFEAVFWGKGWQMPHNAYEFITGAGVAML